MSILPVEDRYLNILIRRPKHPEKTRQISFEHFEACMIDSFAEAVRQGRMHPTEEIYDIAQRVNYNFQRKL